MALFGKVLAPGRSVVTYNLHCESRGSDDLRYLQLREFLQHAKCHSPGMPVLAAGDFNFDVSQGLAAAALANMEFLNPFAPLRQATTTSHPLSVRDHVIDWILLRGPLVGTNPQIHSSVVASDHYPLSVSVSFSVADPGGRVNQVLA